MIKYFRFVSVLCYDFKLFICLKLVFEVKGIVKLNVNYGLFWLYIIIKLIIGSVINRR